MLSYRGRLGGLAAGLVIFTQPLAALAFQEREPATVARVVDGDTVRVALYGREETVRLIGLDTPETSHPLKPVQCFGREATARAGALLPAGIVVGLEADPTQGDRDRYDRILRYIWLPDGRSFAEVIIEEGYGFEYTYAFPYRYMDAFKAAQRAAREGERGLWGPNACEENRLVPRGRPEVRGPTPPNLLMPGRGGAVVGEAYPCQPGQIKGNRNSGIYHAPGQQYYRRTHANVHCFDGEADAAAAGYRRAKR